MFCKKRTKHKYNVDTVVKRNYFKSFVNTPTYREKIKIKIEEVSVTVVLTLFRQGFFAVKLSSTKNRTLFNNMLLYICLQMVSFKVNFGVTSIVFFIQWNLSFSE